MGGVFDLDSQWAVEGMTTSPLTDKDAISPLADVEAMCNRLEGWDGDCWTATLEDCKDAAAMLRSLSKDAERYRWLRDANGYDNNIGIFFCFEDGDMDFPNEVMADTAIDAALAAKELP